MDFSSATTAWRKNGYVVLPELLAGPEFDAAVAELPLLYPSAEEYHADPLSVRHRRFNGDEFGGITSFPFRSVGLCNLVVCDVLVQLAEALFGSEDLRIYAAELWAKYAGSTSYEQEHHRDYLNHTPLVPSADLRWRGLEMFVWLCDVTESLGATRVVPLSASAGLPAVPHGYRQDERPELYESEVTSDGRAGTVVAYSTETFHRGTELTDARSARFSAHVSYRRADAPWLSRHAWGDKAFEPEWNPFFEQASLRQLLLFGVPPPGHPYWTPETLEGMRTRYPRLDLSPWAEAVG
jgi:hypothetical protein